MDQATEVVDIRAVEQRISTISPVIFSSTEQMPIRHPCEPVFRVLVFRTIILEDLSQNIFDIVCVCVWVCECVSVWVSVELFE